MSVDNVKTVYRDRTSGKGKELEEFGKDKYAKKKNTSYVTKYKEKNIAPEFKELTTELTTWQDNLQKELDVLDFDTVKGNPVTLITSKFFNPLQYFVYKKDISLGRNIEEYDIAFKYFVEMVEAINEKTSFVPTKNTFCRFVNISPTTFNYHCNAETEFGMLFQNIRAYLQDILMQNSLHGRVSPVPAIFVAKSNLDLRDDTPQITQNNISINFNNKSVDEIAAQFGIKFDN